MPTEHLIKAPGEYGPEDVRAGMASFVGTGPPGKTCGDCLHRGYWRQFHTQARDYPGDSGLRTRRSAGCAKFRALTGTHGPSINKVWRACKYFEALPDANADRQLPQS